MLAPHIVDYLNYHFINNNRILFYSTKLMERMSFGSMATGGIFAYIAFYKDKYLIYIFSKHLQLFNLVILLTCWILNINFLFNDQFYATLFGILIINFAINPNVLFSLEYKVFNYLGKISYGLYVYHLMAFSINNFIIYFFQIKEIPMIVIFLMGLLLTIFLAAISYEFIEKPFLKIKSNKFTIVKSDR
jgi:peptidoglycan/LPS O-acetylase OafA/YrhL